MNNIQKEQDTTVKIYREFFVHAEAEIKKQLNSLKDSKYCTNCRNCCKIRYLEFSPQELKKQGKNEFLQIFLPLGAKNENDLVDLRTNQLEAINVDKEYVLRVIENSSQDCWFYTCKYYQNGSCKKAMEKPFYCYSYPLNICNVLHKNCGFIQWQKTALSKLENEIAKDIWERIQNISKYKQEFSCSCCATCCKLACSEFSYEKLKEKAQNGDKFAKQFTSIFLPYKNEKDAYKIYGEYIDYLRETLGENEKVYFYYCPKNKNNLCTDYENRPEICKEFPTNPLMILPKSCGYKAWQEETHTATLLLHALVEIVDFYMKKLKKQIKNN